MGRRLAGVARRMSGIPDFVVLQLPENQRRLLAEKRGAFQKNLEAFQTILEAFQKFLEGMQIFAEALPCAWHVFSTFRDWSFFRDKYFL